MINTIIQHLLREGYFDNIAAEQELQQGISEILKEMFAITKNAAIESVHSVINDEEFSMHAKTVVNSLIAEFRAISSAQFFLGKIISEELSDVVGSDVIAIQLNQYLNWLIYAKQRNVDRTNHHFLNALSLIKELGIRHKASLYFTATEKLRQMQLSKQIKHELFLSKFDSMTCGSTVVWGFLLENFAEYEIEFQYISQQIGY